MKEPQPLKILLLSAEVVPFAKTGGLADVAGSLPKEIHALGHDIRVAMPRYGRIDPLKFGLEEILPAFPVPMDAQMEKAAVLRGSIGPGVPIYMIDNAKYYDRDSIYMYPDDAERFIFFCRSSLEMLKRLGYKVTVKTSALEALELFRKQPHKFDLVISDMIMPKLTGDILARELTIIRQDIPIIICTGFPSKVSDEKVVAMPIKALLRKPLSKQEIAETVRNVLDGNP